MSFSRELNFSSNTVPLEMEVLVLITPQHNVLLFFEITLTWKCGSSPLVIGMSDEHKEVTENYCTGFQVRTEKS